MSEFDELLERLRHQREALRESMRRLDLAIELMEEAKSALEPEALARVATAFPVTHPENPEVAKRTRGDLRPAEIVASVVAVLSEAGRPMKRGALVKELERRNVLLAGKDKNKNLGTILWRHQRQFVHIERLGYWLRDVPIEGIYTPNA